MLAATAPDVVVNAAAYTAVDAAESDEPTAYAVNATGPQNLARACAARPGTRLVHISTDYVFSGEDEGPYDEDAPPAPRSAYGRTKLAGELAVRSALADRSFVVRTAWLYSAHGANFVKTMLKLEGDRETVSVVDDQRGQPTWSRDLGGQILALIAAGAAPGIYHGTNSGAVTWFGFTQEIFRLAGADPRPGPAHDQRASSAARRRGRATRCWATGAGPRPGWRPCGPGRRPWQRRCRSSRHSVPAAFGGCAIGPRSCAAACAGQGRV